MRKSVCRKASGRNEIETASRVRQGCARPDWTRRFIRGASRGCKVRDRPGIHHRPSRLSRTQGQPRGRKGGNAEGRKIRGNPEIRRRQRQRMRKPGQPGGNIGRRSWESGAAGQPATQANGSAEGCETRGNPRLHRWHNRKVLQAGATRRKHCEARLKERGRGATRRIPQQQR